MDETIRIRSVDKSEWNAILKGFQADSTNQLFEIYGADGKVIGYICESAEHKYYINGQPKVDYPTLQAAAGALLKTENGGQ